MHRLVTFMLSDVAVVPNVPLKSAKHAVPSQIQLKTLNTLESQQNTLKTIGVRHKGHPFPISVTVFAHAEQKRAWPHGTNATPSRGTSRQTSHISVAYIPDKVLFFCLNVAVQLVIVFLHKATAFRDFFRTYQISCHDN